MSLNRTPIEWVKNPDGTQGYTWNPITGCLNHTDGLCKGGGFPCYAYKLAHGRLRYVYMMGLAKDRIPVGDNYKLLRDPFCPHFWEDRLDDLRTWTAAYLMPPRGIFVCDMGELFGDWVPREWQDKIFEIIKECSQHRFYLLTKQPQNLIKFSPFPDNCWVGVTATDEISAWSASFWLGMSGTISFEAKVKFISFEPLLRSIDGSYDFSLMTKESYLEAILKPINWVILGAQTKPYKPPKIEWVEEIVRACDKAGVKVFLKDNLSDLIPVNSPLRYGPAGELRLRQELPKC